VSKQITIYFLVIQRRSAF